MDTKTRVIVVAALLVGLGPASVGTAAAAAGGTVDDISVTDRYDRDGDGKYSAFTVSVTADTRVGRLGDFSTEPYFKIYVNGQLVRTTDVVSTTQNGMYEFRLSNETLAEFSTGRPDIRVELWERDAASGDDEFDSAQHTPAAEFEPQSKDYSKTERALIGIDSLQKPYTTVSKRLDVSYLQQEQIEAVTDAFAALLPTTAKEASLDAAMTLLETAASVSVGWAENLLAVPTVAANVDSSLDAGKQANTLTKTDDDTRRSFHRYLDTLEQQTNDTGTDPETVSDAELENRLDTIEKVYEYSRDYESEVENTYTDNQGYFPSIIIDLYGADQASLKQAQGVFTQLRQNLIADYYYTQLALEPNQQPTNLTTAVGYQEPSYPEAKIVGYDIPETATVGEPTTVSVTVKTENADTPSQTVTTGFPDAGKVSDIRISDNDISNPSYATVYDRNSELWVNYGDRQETVDYPVAETAGSLSAGSTHTVEVTFVPTETGTVRLWFKSIAWTDTGTSGSLVPDPKTDGSGVVTDEQEELAYEKTITVEAADSDGDGLVDGEDDCPDAAEDDDGYRDGDGCPENPAPSASLGETQVQEGQSVTLSASGNDPEGESLSYEWTLDGAGSLSGSGASVTYEAPSGISSDKSPTVTVAVSEPDAGKSTRSTTTVTVTENPANNDPDGDGLTNSEDDCANAAEDGDGYRDGDGCPENPAPTVSVSDTQVEEGQSVTLSADADDPEGSSLSYEWTLDGDGTLSGSGASVTYRAPGDISSDKRPTVTVSVSEPDADRTARDSATVSVTNTAAPNSQPTADAGGPYIVNESASVALDSSASADSDGSIESRSWAVVSGPGSISDGTYQAPGDVGATEQTATVELTVADDDGATNTTTATVTVAPTESADTGSTGSDDTGSDTDSTGSDGSDGSSPSDGPDTDDDPAVAADGTDGSENDSEATDRSSPDGSPPSDATGDDTDGTAESAGENVTDEGGQADDSEATNRSSPDGTAPSESAGNDADGASDSAVGSDNQTDAAGEDDLDGENDTDESSSDGPAPSGDADDVTDGTGSVVDNSSDEDTGPAADDGSDSDSEPAVDNSSDEDTEPAVDDSSDEDIGVGGDNSSSEQTGAVGDNSSDKDTEPAADNSSDEDTEPAADNSSNEETGVVGDNSSDKDTEPAADNSSNEETGAVGDNSSDKDTEPAADNSSDEDTGSAGEDDPENESIADSGSDTDSGDGTEPTGADGPDEGGPDGASSTGSADADASDDTGNSSGAPDGGNGRDDGPDAGSDDEAGTSGADSGSTPADGSDTDADSGDETEPAGSDDPEGSGADGPSSSSNSDDEASDDSDGSAGSPEGQDGSTDDTAPDSEGSTDDAGSSDGASSSGDTGPTGAEGDTDQTGSDSADGDTDQTGSDSADGDTGQSGQDSADSATQRTDADDSGDTIQSPGEQEPAGADTTEPSRSSTGDSAGDGPTDDTVDDVGVSIATAPDERANATIPADDSSAAGPTVDFGATETVEAVRFERSNVSGTVAVSEYDSAPEPVERAMADQFGTETDDLSVVSVVDISPDSRRAAASAATIELTVDRADVGDSGRLTIVHEHANGTWTPVETVIEGTTDDRITVSADVDSFSLFAVVSGDEPPAAMEDSASMMVVDATTQETTVTAAEGPGFGVVAALLALVVALSLARRRER